MKTTKKIWAQCKNFVKLCDILKRKDFKICILFSNSNVGREFQFHFQARVVTSVHLCQPTLIALHCSAFKRHQMTFKGLK